MTVKMSAKPFELATSGGRSSTSFLIWSVSRIIDFNPSRAYRNYLTPAQAGCKSDQTKERAQNLRSGCLHPSWWRRREGGGITAWKRRRWRRLVGRRDAWSIVPGCRCSGKVLQEEQDLGSTQVITFTFLKMIENCKTVIKCTMFKQLKSRW